MNEKRMYKRYLQSFTTEAVALLSEQDCSVSEAAQSLDIRPNQLYAWKTKQKATKKSEILSVDERVELKSVHEQLKVLRMEKDIKYCD